MTTERRFQFCLNCNTGRSFSIGPDGANCVVCGENAVTREVDASKKATVAPWVSSAQARIIAPALLQVVATLSGLCYLAAWGLGFETIRSICGWTFFAIVAFWIASPSVAAFLGAADQAFGSKTGTEPKMSAAASPAPPAAECKDLSDQVASLVVITFEQAVAGRDVAGASKRLLQTGKYGHLSPLAIARVASVIDRASALARQSRELPAKATLQDLVSEARAFALGVNAAPVVRHSGLGAGPGAEVSVRSP